MNKFLSLIFCLLLSDYALIAQEQEMKRFVSIEPKDFKYLVKCDTPNLVADVRESFEYKINRIKGAVNIPSSGNLEFAADTLNKNLALFFYCTSGFRSEKVCEKFSDKGFRKIYNLNGGIGTWKKKGFPVERRRPRKK